MTEANAQCTCKPPPLAHAKIGGESNGVEAEGSNEEGGEGDE